jgi:SAM-dependent methyltransferase
MIEPLLQAVPASAARILEVGCGQGEYGKLLKERGGEGRHVFGIERDVAAAAIAAQNLDMVFRLDIEQEAPPLEEGSLDCILFNHALERFADPLSVLRRLQPLLKEDGVLLCAVANAQNHAVISALFTNDFQYHDSGLPDRRHLRFFTLSSLYKLMLDADFLPNLLHAVISPCSNEFLQAAIPLADYFRIDPAAIHQRLSTYHYVVAAFPLPKVTQPEESMSFVVCCNDRMQLENNLAASPCFQGRGHELFVVENAASAADGINSGLERTRHRLVVALHQDVYLPQGWPARFQAQWRLAESTFGPLGMAGVFGVSAQPGGFKRTGRIIDGGRLIYPPFALPAPASSLDEVVLGIMRDSEVRLDPALGWHCYGTDAVFETARRGWQIAILDAPCLHNSRFSGLKADFVASAMALAEKWQEPRPLYTTCIRVGEDGGLAGW